MLILPKIRNFICLNANYDGCKVNILKKIKLISNKKKITGPKNVIIIGSSSGYGLACSIISLFLFRAKTIGVFFEKESRCFKHLSSDFNNMDIIEKEALNNGLYFKSINGNSFSFNTKMNVINLIKKDLGKVDLIVYSIASSRFINNSENEEFYSYLKPIGDFFCNKTVNMFNNEIKKIKLLPAKSFEISETIKVMGGKDWYNWINLIKNNKLIAENFKTVAFSYRGPKITYPIYKLGTIGMAKKHLFNTSYFLNKNLFNYCGGRAFISYNKAIVTKSSTVIPSVPLYISILYKIMKEKGLHEDSLEQIWKLFYNYLYSDDFNMNKNFIELDNFELDFNVQNCVNKIWNIVNSDNILDVTDFSCYKKDFYSLFGFNNYNI